MIDELYFRVEVRRSDVEALFARTGKPAADRSMELIGECLRDTDEEKLKEVILRTLLTSIREATEKLYAKKQAERKAECAEE